MSCVSFRRLSPLGSRDCGEKMARVNVIRSPRPVSVSSGIFPWFRRGTYVDLLLLADIFCPRCLFLSVFWFCSRRDFFCCYRCCTFFCPHRSFSRPLSRPVRSGPIRSLRTNRPTPTTTKKGCCTSPCLRTARRSSPAPATRHCGSGTPSRAPRAGRGAARPASCSPLVSAFDDERET